MLQKIEHCAFLSSAPKITSYASKIMLPSLANMMLVYLLY